MGGAAGDKRTAPDEPEEGGAAKRQKQGRDGGGATKLGEIMCGQCRSGGKANSVRQA